MQKKAGVFVTVNHLYPSLIFPGRGGAYQNEATYFTPLRHASLVPLRLEVKSIDKHTTHFTEHSYLPQ
jgi:hypothetical protein